MGCAKTNRHRAGYLRSQSYYQTPEGRIKKKALNQARSKAIISGLVAKPRLKIIAYLCAAVIGYTRCFNSKFSRPLDHSIFDNTLPGGQSPSPQDMTERMFHNLIMNYRDKHIAHSDDFLKAGTVGGCRQGDSYGVAPVLAGRVPHEDRAFYEGLHRLVIKAHRVASERLNDLNTRLLQHLQEGTARLTDQPSQVTPIPLEVDPLTMWGAQ